MTQKHSHLENVTIKYLNVLTFTDIKYISKISFMHEDVLYKDTKN